ncbi:uncharacterized protein LOC129612944 [Condylostylus longicornis]|uniref:uncharacterized protein LOC129612944 n=1 Tax=Condylostylus longicornis TaxID=2530218 RepID=UPI00244E27E8|nr:uncharacterized protein LOC129612944 [Condylostylus longicornis]
MYNKNFYGFLIIILFNIYLGHCNVNIINAIEGEMIEFQCTFNISNYDDNDFQIFWIFPDDSDIEAYYDEKINNNKISSYFTINNVTKIRHEGIYGCILSNSTSYLNEIQYKLTLRNDTSNINLSDTIQLQTDYKNNNYLLIIGLLVGAAIILSIIIITLVFLVLKKQKSLAECNNESFLKI